MNINNRKSLIKSLLSDRLTVKRRKDFAELISVDNEIKKQWNESGKRMGDDRIKEQIWKKIKSRCSQERKYKVLAELRQNQDVLRK